MDLSTLRPAPGSKRRRVRVGRGIGSGSGKTAGRGHKGKGSRSGGNTPPGYEGGQMPLKRRVPKRGFRRLQKTQARREEFAVVNLKRLAALGLDTIDPAVLAERGVIGAGDKLKVLGDGELGARLTVRAHAFSASAREKIAAAGGIAELIEAAPKLNA
ncbi:MAG TPA: 50S ribosomal protein L15 [Candidatus Binataceae bacterium]|nr:50S ribosomal protein L15 [Candidatus Binataceae bacterium]